MLPGQFKRRGVFMNADNERLREIQISKLFYKIQMKKAENTEDCMMIKEKIDELETEEIDILQRFDVIV